MLNQGRLESVSRRIEFRKLLFQVGGIRVLTAQLLLSGSEHFIDHLDLARVDGFLDLGARRLDHGGVVDSRCYKFEDVLVQRVAVEVGNSDRAPLPHHVRFLGEEGTERDV